MALGAGQWTALFFLACAVLTAGLWQFVAKPWIEGGTQDLPRRGGMMEGPEVRPPDVPVHAVKPCAVPGQPDALDLLIATAMPAELLAAAEEAISEALMILARAADLVAVAR